MAAHAFDGRVRAVELDEPLGGSSAAAVQPIDVLRDDHRELARPLEIRDRGVHGIRLRIPDEGQAWHFWSQYSMRASLRVHEVLEVDGLPFPPDTFRAAEVPDAAARRDACSGEYQDAVGVAQQLNEIHCARSYRPGCETLIPWTSSIEPAGSAAQLLDGASSPKLASTSSCSGRCFRHQLLLSPPYPLQMKALTPCFRSGRWYRCNSKL